MHALSGRAARLAFFSGFALLAGCAQQQSAPPQPAPTPVAYNPPAAGLAALPANGVAWYQVTFASNSTVIDGDGQMALGRAADAMQGNTALMATVVGRSDAVGGDAANMRLSKQRADAVRRALLRSGKVSAQRIEERWTGERPEGNRPMVAGADAGNRVVDIALH